MTSRSGPLSDEYILAHCQRYRPIPLGAAQYILMKDLKPQHEHAFGNKPLKYHTQMARPKDFDTLAKAITKMSGNPMVRDELNSAYSKDLQSVPSVPSVPNSDSAQSIPTVDQQASIIQKFVRTRSSTRAAEALMQLAWDDDIYPSDSVSNAGRRSAHSAAARDGSQPRNTQMLSPVAQYAAGQQLRANLSHRVPEWINDPNREASDWSSPSEPSSDEYMTDDYDQGISNYLASVQSLGPYAFRDPLDHRPRIHK